MPFNGITTWGFFLLLGVFAGLANSEAKNDKLLDTKNIGTLNKKDILRGIVEGTLRLEIQELKTLGTQHFNTLVNLTGALGVLKQNMNKTDAVALATTKNLLMEYLNKGISSVMYYLKKIFRAGSQSLELLRQFILDNIETIKRKFADVKHTLVLFTKRVVQIAKATKKLIVKMIKIGVGTMRGFGLDSVVFYGKWGWHRILKAFADVRSTAADMAGHVMLGTKYLLLVLSMIPYFLIFTVAWAMWRCFNSIRTRLPF